MTLETLPELHKVHEVLPFLCVIEDMDLELELREGQDLELIHHGVEGCKLVTLNINLEHVNPLVAVLLHDSLESLPDVAFAINSVLVSNKVLEEVDVGVTSGIYYEQGLTDLLGTRLYAHKKAGESNTQMHCCQVRSRHIA